MTLPELKLNFVSQSTFGVSYGDDVVRTPLEGGLPRARRGAVGAPHVVRVSWLLRSLEKDYLRTSFFRSTLAEGSLPFKIKLPVDGIDHDEHEAIFIGDMALEDQYPNLSRVSATLQLKPLPLDGQYAGALSFLYEDLEHDFSQTWENPLDHLVNDILTGLEF